MSLSIGIVGLPNVGKSTLFNALTKNSVAMENYPFCTIDPTVGVVHVPDERLQTLSKMFNSEKIIPAVVEFVDIAGLVRGASAGEGLGNQFLANIREVDMIIEVVRIFDDNSVHHVSGQVNPVADIEVINLELIMADIQTITKRIGGLEKEIKRGDKSAQEEQIFLKKLSQHLEQGKLINTFENISAEERKIIKNLHLLTAKEILYVCNKKQGAFNLDEQNDSRWQELLNLFSETNAEYVLVDAGLEHELKDLETEEKNEFRREYGNQDKGVENLIRSCYKKLGLISFFTAGEKEVRAWTVKDSATAPEAGGAIHTDFKTKYIKAQVVSFADLVASGSKAAARDQGKIRTEGKDYIVQDGDVMEFLHS